MFRRLLATLAVATAMAILGPGGAAVARPATSHLHSGEYCTKHYQHWYHRHGYTCKRASDGKLRLFEW